MKPRIQVACGVVQDAAGCVLIAQRPAGKIAAGKWEFPGGKIEAGESAHDALKRELHEELGVELREARPLIRFTHAYADRVVTLSTWLVTRWDGELHGRESQRFEWHRPDAAITLDVLPTVAPILRALLLPEDYVFTPPDLAPDQLVLQMQQLPRGALLRLRRPGLAHAAYQDLARRVIDAAPARALRIVLDRGEPMARWLGAAGVHFTQGDLMQLEAADMPPLPQTELLRFASCHDRQSLQHAAQLGLDAVVIGNVQATSTHPDRAGTGWSGFSTLTEDIALPAYAIGGLGPADKPMAFAQYAQGVAGISAYWSRSGS
ncbi:MAG: Nudix family hydrolase [Panacagrimonas sp.]